MQVIKTNFPNVLVIEPKVFADNRGWFHESYHGLKYPDIGISKPFVQDNLSRSSKHVLRGLHFQLEQPQAKLVFVLKGRVLDVVVDVRYGSPTFGQWFSVELSDENHRQLYIPEGFAHGFYALTDEVDFFYKCSDYYHPQSEVGIVWNDPDLGIDWQLTADPIISEKDAKNFLLKNIPKESLPQYKANV